MDPFATALSTEAELRAIYDPPSGLAAGKEIDHLDDACCRLIACAPLVFVATHDANGLCDVTPRGGPAGFVTVLDEHRLVIPDATGNRRIDTMRNVVETGRAGLIFVVPGRTQTLRVNGRACVSVEPELLESLKAVGKPPRTALVVEAEEVFTHCAKALVRSHAWEPETWLAADEQPSPAELLHAHVGDPSLAVADVAAYLDESLAKRLA